MYATEDRQKKENESLNARMPGVMCVLWMRKRLDRVGAGDVDWIGGNTTASSKHKRPQEEKGGDTADVSLKIQDGWM